MSTVSPVHAWLTFPKPNRHARLRLFCFPYAGGGASIYRAWPDHLPPDIDVCSIRLPGRENRLKEAPFTQLPALIQALMGVLSEHFDKPFLFFGHSLGALISFELARALRECQSPGPAQLFVSGCRAPQLPDREPPMRHLPDPEFVAGLRRLKGTPENVLHHRELMQLLLPTLRADFALFETYAYEPQEPLDCPIFAYCGLEDTKTGRDEMMAWRAQTRGAFSLRMFPGDHFFLHRDQAMLLQVMSQEIRTISLGLDS